MNITNNLQSSYIKVTVSIQGTGKKYYQAYLQYKENGQQKYKTKTTGIPVNGGSKKLAKEKAEEIRQQFELEINAPETSAEEKEKLLFGDYMLQWLETQKPNIQNTTYSGYERNVKRTAEYFNNLGITLKNLKTSDIQKYYNYLQKPDKNGKSIKYNTIKRYHANIHKSLEDAIQLELIETNPASKIKHKKIEQYIAPHYNQQELEQLFEISKDNQLELHILIASHYGLRRSELVGLKWENINFNDNTITISHIVTEASINGKFQVVKKDKTKNKTSYRTLPLIPSIRKLLLAEQEKQKQNKKIYGNSYENKDNYILVREDGSLIRPGCITENFRKLINEKGLKKITFKDLRHSCASLLLANGINMKQIQEWLGHSNFSTTANIYSHLEKDTKEISANAIATAFEKKSA